MTPPESSSFDTGHLLSLLDALPPWSNRDFTGAEWQRFSDAAAAFREAHPQVVEAALSEFVRQALTNDYQGFDPESKPFLLMRVLFDLRESSPAAELRSFKGWTNWPTPDSRGNVSLSWPVDWSQGRPRLVASYEGSMGVPYDAAAEYRWLLDRYPFRRVPGVREP